MTTETDAPATPRKRLRVRPLAKVSLAENRAVTSQLCLSTPHVGEAIDLASDSYRLREAQQGRGWERELHFGHLLGRKCEDAPAELAGRCLYLDYVDAETEKDQDELDVAGLVAKAR